MNENDSREDAPTRLHEVTIPYIADCRPYFPQPHRVDPTIQFCAGKMPNGGKDACNGDSGSGIFGSDDDDSETGGKKNTLLVGLVSWGIGCARPNRPGVYARISTIERWLEHMKCQVSDFPPTDQCTTLLVQMTVDDYPEEIGLSLLDATTTTSAAAARNGSSNQQQAEAESSKPESAAAESEVVVLPIGTLTAAARQTLQYTFRVPKGRDYLLRVYDKNHDGFCCNYGQGSLTVVATDDNILYTLSNPNFTTEFTSLLLPQVGTGGKGGGGANPSNKEEQGDRDSGGDSPDKEGEGGARPP